MTEEKYIEQLRSHLTGMPREEVEAAVIYCSEYFSEAGEEKALEDLGSPSNFARSVIGESIGKIIEKDYQTSRTSSAKNWWLLILGILSLPLSLPLLIVVVSLLFTAFVVGFAFILVAFVMFIAAIALIIAGVFSFAADIPSALFLMAVAFMLVGISLITISFVSRAITSFIPWVARKIRGFIHRREGKV